MILTNEELKKIWFVAYEFEEKDGYLKANQYSKPQMEYFYSALEMWAERCDASTAKTFEFTTDATVYRSTTRSHGNVQRIPLTFMLTASATRSSISRTWEQKAL